MSFYNNTITSEGSGGAGIEIQKYGTPAMDDIEVYNNTIYRTALAGIWIFGSGSYLHILRQMSISIITRSMIPELIQAVNSRRNLYPMDSMLLIENNVIDGAYGAGIVQKNVYFFSSGWFRICDYSKK